MIFALWLYIWWGEVWRAEARWRPQGRLLSRTEKGGCFFIKKRERKTSPQFLAKHIYNML